MTDINVNVLFRPLAIKSLLLKNRIVMAPMTRFFAPGGTLADGMAEYYSKRADGGIGLIISEGTAPERTAARNHPNVPNFFGEQALAKWKTVVDSVHGAGGKMGPQLWHVGAAPNRYTDWKPATPPESPSGLLDAKTKRGMAMTDSEIGDTIAAYASAATSAKSLGFDMLEIHAAHGYLLDQFFWGETNRRNGIFGGTDIKQRNRFALEVIRAVREALGPDLPLSLRVSQWKEQVFTARIAQTPAEMELWLGPLVEAGVDILHCSQRRFGEAEFPEMDGTNGLNFAGWAKKLTGAVTISVGSVGLSGDFLGSFDGEQANNTSLLGLTERMERNEFDLIAIGRGLIKNADWAHKVRAGNFDGLGGFEKHLLDTLD